ncbi:MAG: amino acid permease [Thermomicrobiales bacterium]
MALRGRDAGRTGRELHDHDRPGALGTARDAGLLGATFSSGLASLVGAPRIMQALSGHNILPASRTFARRTRRGEPRNALIFTGFVVLAGLLLRDLNAIAPFVTLFFLITYATINVVVLFEQSLDLVSFRPSIRVPLIVPLAGTAGTIGAMFIINPIFSLAGVAVVIGFYLLLMRQRLSAPHGDLRSGLFVAIAEWAAKRVAALPDTRERAWKPNLLAVVEDPSAALDTFEVIQAITHPRGSVQYVGVQNGGGERNWNTRMRVLTEAFRDDDIFASWTVIETDSFRQGMVSSIQALSGAFLAPNVVFLPISSLGYQDDDEELRYIASKASDEDMGLIFFAGHPSSQLGEQQTINIWIRDRSPAWDLEYWLGDLNLAMLVGYQISNNWKGQLRLVSAVADHREVENCRAFLEELSEVARLARPEIFVTEGSFTELLEDAPAADLNIFGLGPQFNLTQSTRLAEQLGATCLFIRDSGTESALA